MTTHDWHIFQLLTRLETGRAVSQRSLSRELGIALGLTNCLFRQMQRNGWVEVTRLHENRSRYVITPAGLEQEAAMARAHFHESVRSYTEARDRIRHRLLAISAAWPPTPESEPEDGQGRRIVFYGAGEVAEIGYVSLQGTGLQLVGVVDDGEARTFFGLPVRSPDQLHRTDLAGQPFDRLLVMSSESPSAIRLRLDALGCADRADWV